MQRSDFVSSVSAAYQEDQPTKHIYEVAIRSTAAGDQLKDGILALHNRKFFHLSAVGKLVLVP